MFNKNFNKDDVKRLVDEIGKTKMEPPIEVGTPTLFGLSVDAYDPVSNTVIAVCRPHRNDIADHPEICLTPAQVRSAVATARANRLHDDRAAGFMTPEQAAATRKARDENAAAQRSLAIKHADEMDKLRVDQATKVAQTQKATPATKADSSADEARAVADRREAERVAADPNASQVQKDAAWAKANESRRVADVHKQEAQSRNIPFPTSTPPQQSGVNVNYSNPNPNPAYPNPNI